MKIKYFFSISLLCIVMSFSCNSDNKQAEKLKRIPLEHIVHRMKVDSFNISKAKYSRMNGAPLTEENKKFLNKGKYGKEYFQDTLGVIREIRIRNQEFEDILLDIQMAAIASKPFSGMPKITIDCSMQSAFYEEISKSMEANNGTKADRKSIIVRNVQAIVASIKHCGWPEEHIELIWNVMHQSPSAIQAYYYADFQRFASENKLEVSRIAATEDKLLMSYGYPQRYGTQIVDGHLYKLQDPEKVDELRASKGLVPLEKFLTHWGLDLEEELANM